MARMGATLETSTGVGTRKVLGEGDGPELMSTGGGTLMLLLFLGVSPEFWPTFILIDVTISPGRNLGWKPPPFYSMKSF